MSDKTIIEYGDAFEFKDKPDSSFYFKDFDLHYWGYLPSSNKFLSGSYIFSLRPKTAELGEQRSDMFAWSAGAGALAPIHLMVSDKPFTFYPYTAGEEPIRVVEGHE